MHLSVCNANNDLVFVLDSSGSIGPDNWALMLNFVSSVIDRLSVASDKIHVGLVNFGTSASVELHLGNYTRKSDLLDVVANLDYMGGITNTASALNVMREEVFREESGDRSDVPDVAIVVTHNASSEAYTVEEAELAHAQGISIFAVGIGDEDTLNIEELEGIATRDELTTVTPDFLTLGGIVNPLLEEVCGGTTVVNAPDPGGCNLDLFLCLL